MGLQQRVFVLRGVDATLLIGARAEFGGRPPRRRQAANALARLRRAQDDPFVMAELRRWFTRWQLDPPQLTPAGDAELVRRTVAAIDRGRLVARLVPVARTPATGGGGDERSFRLAQAGGPAPRARTGADLVAMSPAERIAEMLERTIPRLPGHVRDEFVALLVGAGVMRVAAIAAGWIVSHAVGVGEVIDLALAALLVVGAVVSGWAVIEGARDFARALGMAASAASDAELDAAADLMASAVTTLGVAAISILLLRAKGSGGGDGGGGKAASRPRSNATTRSRTDSRQRASGGDDVSSQAAPAATQTRDSQVGAKAAAITPDRYNYVLDDLGRPVEASGKLKLGKGKRDQSAQKTAGGSDRLDDDDGGHLIAARFGGGYNAENLVPQNANLNRSAWKKMENEWADALKNGKEVEVRIRVEYEGDSKRPSRFIVEHVIGEGDAVRTEFVNEAGQTFTRSGR